MTWEVAILAIAYLVDSYKFIVFNQEVYSPVKSPLHLLTLLFDVLAPG